MYTGVAKIRLARGVAGDFCANPFKLPAADVLQILPLRRGRCRFVEIDRNLITLPNLFADVAGHGHAVLDGDAVDGNERDNVGRSHARVRTLMLRQVEEFGSLAYSADSGFLDGLALADQSDDAAVVVGVHFAVEEINAVPFNGGES